MLMGEVCTRACRFCAVDTGNPRGWLDAEEPANAARTVQLMGLKYVVLTSVNRDDLPDGGAAHFAACVREIRQLNPGTAVEALTPDFQGVMRDVETVVDSGLDVFAQNVETVRRLTHPVRDPRASYDQTLAVLAHAKQHRREQVDVLVKTSLMLGLGETDAEIRTTMEDLRAAGVDILTLGQYLRPTVNHLTVERFVHAGRVRRVPRTRAGAWLPRVRVRPAGALELSRGAGAGAQQRRPGRGRARATWLKRGQRRADDDGRVRARLPRQARRWPCAGSASRLRADVAGDAGAHGQRHPRVAG